MVTYIQKEFIKILEEIDWMDPVTTKKALEKAKAISPFIGYPAELSNDTKVSEFHQNVSLLSFF
jgi:neprilysin, putative (fragment)